MKSIADFKRAMKLGTVWHTYHNLYHSDMGIRECSKINTVGFGFKTVRQDGSIGTSHCEWPTKDLVEFVDGAVLIYYPPYKKFDEHYNEIEMPRRLVLTYKQVA